MPCRKCDGYSAPFSIGRPEQLTRAITIAREAISAGVLAEIPHDGRCGAHFDEVRLDGPWDDTEIHNFSCNFCGQKFSLTAHTYRGSGGSWGPDAP
ncbi:MAG: hypothetical protein SXU28_10370 [Pseudomonadota bacterium]|nr:hypothetical protein [Pseudomonadota bacterium]